MSREAGKHSQVKDERLDSINALFRAGTIDAQAAQRQVEELVEQLRKAERPDTHQYLDSNMDILDRYFREEYETRDILPNSLKAAKASFRRALKLLGKLELPTADVKEVQKRIFALPYKKRQHVVLTLNALFKYIGRKHGFELGKKIRIERVRHLSLKEFLLVLPKIEHPLVQRLAAVGFATGGRVGELFAITQYNAVTRQVTIYTQIDRKLEERMPKTLQSQRTAVVVKELEQHVKDWIATPMEERMTIRNVRLADYVLRACKEVFPNSPDKHCHIKDMRHGYAIHFLSKGASVSLMAQQLGNSEEVCREHYTGFIVSDEGAALLNRLQEEKKAS
jgi:integrase